MLAPCQNHQLTRLTEAVVGAADWLRRTTEDSVKKLHICRISITIGLPGVSWKSDDGERAAGDPDRDGNVLNDNAQKGEESGGCRAVSPLDAVAALNGASAALSRSGSGGSFTTTGGCGDGDSSESKSDESLELHI